MGGEEGTSHGNRTYECWAFTIPHVQLCVSFGETACRCVARYATSTVTTPSRRARAARTAPAPPPIAAVALPRALASRARRSRRSHPAHPTAHRRRRPSTRPRTARALGCVLRAVCCAYVYSLFSASYLRLYLLTYRAPGRRQKPTYLLFGTSGIELRTVLTATSGPPVRCGAVRCGRAIKTIVASGSRPAPETPLNQRAVERTLCSDQSAHAGGWITRGEVLICTTDE